MFFGLLASRLVSLNPAGAGSIFRTRPSVIDLRKIKLNACCQLRTGGYSTLALALGRLNHVAIATPDLKKASAVYRDVLGAQVSPPEDLPQHGVTVVFVNLNNTKIELLHPYGNASPIQKFLDKNKDGGIHHICVEVEDIQSAVNHLEQNGSVRVLDRKPKIGAHGKPVVFLHPKDCGGVLIELEQV